MKSSDLLTYGSAFDCEYLDENENDLKQQPCHAGFYKTAKNILLKIKTLEVLDSAFSKYQVIIIFS